MERKQFTFYNSFYKSISRIKKAADRAAAYDSICAYALFGVEPDIDNLPDSAAIAFEVAKPNLDSSMKKAENGKRGGSSKQTKANEKQMKADDKQNDDLNKQEKEQDKDKDKEQMLSPLSPLEGGERKRFSPPSVEEVRSYCLERMNGIDPEQFVNFYESKGWMIGKDPMKNWKAAVRTWENKRKQEESSFTKMVDYGGDGNWSL